MIPDLDTACFNPNTIAVPEGPAVEFPRTRDHPRGYHHHLHQLQENVPADFAHYSCGTNTDHPTVEEAIDGDPRNANNNQVMPDFVNGQASSWNGNQPGLLQDMLQQLVADQAQTQNGVAAQNSSGEVLPMQPADHLGFFHLFHSTRSSSSSSPLWPSSSLLPKPPLSYTNPNASATSSVLYDPLFHLRNLQPQPLPMGELLYPYVGLPHEDNNGGEFAIDREGGTTATATVMMMHGDDEGVLEMMEGGNRVKIGKRRGGNKLTKHFATERDRRTQLNEKYVALRDLIPNPTKFDRASIVGDAIEYIKELLITVNELNLLMERKRWGRERRCKRRRVAIDEEVEEEVVAVDGGESSITAVTPPGDPADRSFNGALRSSCLQRKSKVTEVDVRIVDDEVVIKLTQRKKINCLLHVARVLNELRLDLHHASGGHIGEHCSFLLNSKICEGSTVYASVIASKVIEVVDRQYYAAAPPPSSCSD